MKKDFGAQTWMYPMPVLIIATYGEDGTPDAMNAAWGGIHDTNQIGICLSAGHKTTKNILKRGAFTVSMADEAHVAACDYVGLVSGNNVPDKLRRARLHVTKSAHVDAPLIDELPMALECKLLSYDADSGYLVGQIINVCADESILGADGKVDARKLKPITYDPVSHGYYALGTRVGDAFKDGNQLK